MYTLGETFLEVPLRWARTDSVRIPWCKWQSLTSPFLLLLETWYNGTFINPGHRKGIAEIQELHWYQEMPTEEHSSTYSLNIKYITKDKETLFLLCIQKMKIAFQRPECVSRREHRREHSSFHLQEVKRSLIAKPSSWEDSAGIISSILPRTQK